NIDALAFLTPTILDVVDEWVCRRYCNVVGLTDSHNVLVGVVQNNIPGATSHIVAQCQDSFSPAGDHTTSLATRSSILVFWLTHQIWVIPLTSEHKHCLLF